MFFARGGAGDDEGDADGERDGYVAIHVTHGGPLGHLDDAGVPGLIGCPVQMEVVRLARPMVCVFGHFHKDRGVEVVRWGGNDGEKNIPTNELLNIWIYVQRVKASQAEMLLWKFEDRHILDLKKNYGTVQDDCMDGYSFSLHHVMRDLASYLVNQDNRPHCRSLFISIRENGLPPGRSFGFIFHCK